MGYTFWIFSHEELKNAKYASLVSKRLGDPLFGSNLNKKHTHLTGFLSHSLLDSTNYKKKSRHEV